MAHASRIHISSVRCLTARGCAPSPVRGRVRPARCLTRRGSRSVSRGLAARSLCARCTSVVIAGPSLALRSEPSFMTATMYPSA